MRCQDKCLGKDQLLRCM